MVGSLSGTEPGFIYDQGLPYPNIHFPLNLVGFIPGTPPQLDPYLSATLSANPGTFVSEFPHIGQFDGLGRAVVKFQLPALTMSLLYGAEVNHVYFILDGNDISGLSGIREIGFDPYLP